MSMNTGPQGQDLIKRFEGLRLEAYQCSAGVWTIGYGHTSAAGGVFSDTKGRAQTEVMRGLAITAEEAERLFKADIDRFDNQVERLVKGIALSQNQFDALVSLAYNIGLGAFARSTVLKRLKRGDERGAADAFLMWNKAGGRVLRGLARRREAERALFLGDKAVVEGLALVARPDEFARAVDVPKPIRTMAQSKTGNTALAITGISLLEGLRQAQEAIALTGGFVAALKQNLTPMAFLAVAGLAAFIWWDRRRRLREDLA
jgi:lysozyme